jgi:hypothetical protein
MRGALVPAQCQHSASDEQDVLACPCGGRRTVTAFVVDTTLARRVLTALRLAAEPATFAPARDPVLAPSYGMSPYASHPSYTHDIALDNDVVGREPGLHQVVSDLLGLGLLRGAPERERAAADYKYDPTRAYDFLPAVLMLPTVAM